jgi:hypothetical protein
MIYAVIFTGLIFVIVTDLRRIGAVRCVERAERLRLRFSDMRHRLVMHAGSGEMESRERNAVVVSYVAITFLLKHPTLYNRISLAFCSAIFHRQARPDEDVAVPDDIPELSSENLSEKTRAILEEYVEACDDMIEQFANWQLVFLAYLSGNSVVDCIRNLGTRHRELEAEKQQLKRWRRVGTDALRVA